MLSLRGSSVFQDHRKDWYLEYSSLIKAYVLPNFDRFFLPHNYLGNTGFSNFILPRALRYLLSLSEKKKKKKIYIYIIYSSLALQSFAFYVQIEHSTGMSHC